MYMYMYIFVVDFVCSCICLFIYVVFLLKTTYKRGLCMALIAQWLERMDQEAGGPGFDPHHVELSGLQVRPFKVSGGSPRPPPEQTPGNRASGRLLESTKRK